MANVTCLTSRALPMCLTSRRVSRLMPHVLCLMFPCLMSVAGCWLRCLVSSVGRAYWLMCALSHVLWDDVCSVSRLLGLTNEYVWPDASLADVRSVSCLNW